jgi:hypothetical protein
VVKANNAMHLVIIKSIKQSRKNQIKPDRSHPCGYHLHIWYESLWQPLRMHITYSVRNSHSDSRYNGDRSPATSYVHRSLVAAVTTQGNQTLSRITAYIPKNP